MITNDHFRRSTATRSLGARTAAGEGPARRIVVGVDGSPGSLEALCWAVEQAELTGAVVEATIAWHLPSYSYGGVMALGPSEVDLGETAAEQLADAVAAVLGEHPPVRVDQVVLEGPVATSLLHRCEGADLLVLGSRGHHAVTGLLLGSVGERCLGRAPCPVVIVPAAQADRTLRAPEHEPAS